MVNYCDSLYYLIFLPIVALIYSVTPKKHRYKILLLASMVFFFSISTTLIVYLFLSILSIHHFGLWLESKKRDCEDELKECVKEEKKKVKLKYKKSEKRIIIFAVLLHIGLLLFFKYTKFFAVNINTLFELWNINLCVPIPKILIPIGISFYTLEALSYIVDVSRGVVKADKNILSLALYLSYFPKMVEGPIAKYEDIHESLMAGDKITYVSLTNGAKRMLYGLIKKVVVADRLNILVKSIFCMEEFSGGGIVALGMIAYTIQLYMDFSGTMDVVIGSSEIFNIKLPENFKQPFFSKSISEFWTRWHITLGTWFKDYIFYPVSLSKPAKKLTTFGRKHLGNHFGPLLAGSLALFFVWLANGLWHGASWGYIFFGMYHFIFILLGNIFEPFINKLYNLTHISRDNFLVKFLRMIKTTFIVLIGELFFRAESLSKGIAMFKVMVTKFNFNFITTKEMFNLGLDRLDYIVVLITVIFVLIISILKERGLNVREYINKKPKVVRWIIYYILIFYLIIFGAYGMNYTPVDPMYAGF